MVVLTIVTQKNGEIVYFDELIPEVYFMKLLSCSLYNSWHNLTKAGQIYFSEDNREVLASIPQGHYTFQSLAEELTKSLEQYDNKKNIKLETNKPNSVLKITVWEPTISKEIAVSHTLGQLINSGLTLTMITYVNKLNSPSTYFIHCDLIDRNKNFFNGKRTDILAKFDVRGKPYEKVSYHTNLQQPFRDCSTDSHVNSITLSVRDQDGELFDFKGMPIEFELEIN